MFGNKTRKAFPTSFDYGNVSPKPSSLPPPQQATSKLVRLPLKHREHGISSTPSSTPALFLLLPCLRCRCVGPLLWVELGEATAQGTHADIFHSESEDSSRLLVSCWSVCASPSSAKLTSRRILAILVNSVYSFWWDVTNDWGLGLLLPSSWKQLAGRPKPYEPLASHSPLSMRHGNRRTSSRPSLGGASKASDPDLLSIVDPSAQRPGTPSHSHQPASPLLRPTLLLSEPLVYHLAIAIDLLLRLTWSLKLSSHLHAIHEIEQGVFLLEALEVLRRWMWLFLRIEWESVRRAAMASSLAMETGSSGEAMGMSERYRDEGEAGEVPEKLAWDGMRR